MAKSVFISSTSQDLQAHRSAVHDTVLALEMLPIDMKYFGSRPGNALEVSLMEVRKADIFIGILAKRYGYIPPGETKSITELEYEEARKKGIPLLMYILDPEHEWHPEFYEDDDEAQSKLQAFKESVETNHVRRLFTTPENLAHLVSMDIARMQLQQSRTTLEMQQVQTTAKRNRQFFAVGCAGVILLVLLLLGIFIFGDEGNRTDFMAFAGLTTYTPTPTATYTPSSTATATNTATNTATHTPTATATNTATHTSTATNTATHTSTATNTATHTPTATSTITPSNTPTATATNTATHTFTPSNTPTVTNTPTPEFTPTFTPTALTSCVGTPPSRLYAGTLAVVLDEDPRPINVRRGPGTGFGISDQLDPGLQFRVLQGPVCADGFAWYWVAYGALGSIDGWVAEGDTESYYVAPLDQPFSAFECINPLVNEGFDNNSTYTWFTGSGSDFEVDISNSAYTIRLIEAPPSGGDAVTWGSLQVFTFDDATIEATIRASDFTTEDRSRTGLWLRYQDESNFIAFFIASTGRYRIARFQDNRYFDLGAGWTDSNSIRTGENVTNVMRVESFGDRFDLYINNDYIESVEDDTWEEGRVAFMGGSPTVPALFFMDDIQICGN